jgi:AraC-like DNA-binding protein
MKRLSNKASMPGWVCGVLKHFLGARGDFARRFHVPSLEGALRHIPGKLLHVMPELFFQLDGANRIEFPSERYLLRAGQACLIPRGLPHSETFIPARGRFRMMVIMFDAGEIDFHMSVLTSSRPSHEEQQGRVETDEAARIAGALDDLARLARNPDRWSAKAYRSLGTGILAWLAAALSARPAVEHYSPKISLAIHLVAKHLEDPQLGTAMLARLIRCAPDYLSALFHKDVKTPLVRYIQRERVNKAQYLLVNSTMSVKEIAAACGFGDPDYFARLFHRSAGLVPSSYRSLHRR